MSKKKILINFDIIFTLRIKLSIHTLVKNKGIIIILEILATKLKSGSYLCLRVSLPSNISFIDQVSIGILVLYYLLHL